MRWISSQGLLIQVLIALALLEGAFFRIARAEELPADVRSRVREATVLVEAYYRPVDDPNGMLSLPSTGSGVVIAPEGLILTNAHCAESVMQWDRQANAPATERSRADDRINLVLKSVKVRLRSGQKNAKTYEAQVLATRPLPVDLALLRIRPERELRTLDLLPTAEFDQLRETSPVWAIGFPNGYNVEAMLASAGLARNPFGPDLEFRDGTISSLRRDETLRTKVVGTTCLIEHGNSGGPLVDKYGRVVGINYLGYEKAHSFAIPVHVALSQFEATLAARHPLAGMPDSERHLLIASTDGDGTIYQLPFTLEEPNPGPGDWRTPLGNDPPSVLFAAACAQPGDTIHVPAGEFQIDRPFVIPAGVWLRGAGVEKTKVVLTTPQATVRVDQPGYIELSDLTILGFKPEAAVNSYLDASVCIEVGPQCGAEVFIHDLHVESHSLHAPGVRISGESSASMTAIRTKWTPNKSFPNNQAGIVVSNSGGAPRIERCHISGFPDGAVIENGARPAVEGCQFIVDGTGLKVQMNSAPRVAGCLFNPPSKSGRLVVVTDAQGIFEANVFGRFVEDGLGAASLEVRRGSQVRFVGNHFNPLGSRALKFDIVNGKAVYRGKHLGNGLGISGAGTQVEFFANVFHGANYSVEGGAKAMVKVPNLTIDGATK